MNDQRLANLQQLLSLVSPVPAEWVEQARVDTKRSREMQPLECRSWETLKRAWYGAIRMRQSLEDVLAVMLATALSTEQEGDQLCLQVIGPPGSGKTSYCTAMLVSASCRLVDGVTGFLSGYQGPDGEASDYSLLSRTNHRCVIIPEGDVLMSNPKFREIMSQIRRIYDGTYSSTFKNRKTDIKYDGIRMPIIIAGTPKIMDNDEASLGDRFVKICVDKPTHSEEHEILMSVVRRASKSVRRSSNCSPDTHMSPEKAVAYKMTGGYLDHLHKDSAELFGKIRPESEQTELAYAQLGMFTAYLRARPNTDPKKTEVEAFRELPSRITEQYVRLGCCLAAVMNKTSIDDDVLRVVRKTAIHTSSVRMMRLVSQIDAEHDRSGGGGCYMQSLARWNGTSDEKMAETVRFLEEIGCVESHNGGGPADSHYRWRLSDRMRGLWRRVTSA